MVTSVKRYLVCLGAVCVLMAGYCAAVVPLLEPRARDAPGSHAATEDTKPDAWWQHLFAGQAWQNADPMVLQTEQGTLLFQSLEQLGPSQWKLAPLTLIVPLSREAKGAAIGDLNAANKVYRGSPLAVVVAPDGADIQFREAPDWTSGSTPPLTGGLLRGPIQIIGIDPRRGDAPQWAIRTANVLIDRRRVWTTSEVQITSGNSTAIGKDLSIHLKQDLLGPSDDDSGPWGLLDYMELVYVKEVSVDLPAGGLWKGMKLGPAATAAAHRDTPARVDLGCRGKFKFDFNESRATLEDHIRIEHRFRNDLVADEFLCHQLDARFSLPDPALPADPTAIMVGPMQLEIIQAIGKESSGPSPSQRTVEIAAPNILAQLNAMELLVNVSKRRFAIKAPESVVDLKYMGSVFRAPSIEYEAAPQDQHMGWLFASGPGEAESDGNSEFGRATARWHKSLSMRPSETGQLVTLEGRALIEADGRGHLGSDHIDVSLMRLVPPAADAPGGRTARPQISQTAAAGASASDNQYQIDRLDAKDEVVMGNQAQTIRVSQLHVQFVYPQNQASPPAGNPGLALSDSSGRPMFQLLGPPSAGSSGAGSSGAGLTGGGSTGASPLSTPTSPVLPPYPVLPSPVPPADGRPGSVASSGGLTALTPSTDRAAPPIGLPAATRAGSGGPPDPLKNPGGNLPVLVLGKELHSQVIVTPDQSWIDRLHISGPVVISSNGRPQQGAADWRIEGSQLQLASGASGQVDLQIVGQPARIGFGDGYIEGPVIRMDQRTGLVWMDHPGEICVPGSLINSRAPGQNVEWLKPLKCRWQGHMLFNGSRANIEGDITIDGCARTAPDRLLFIGGTCSALELLLTQPIDINNPGAASATLHSLSLRRNVDIRTAQRDTSNRRLSLEEISVPELTYEVATNRVIGTGPGWLRSQHVSSSGGMGALASTPKQSSAAVLGQKPVALQGMHLKFRDTMEARLTERQLSFLGKVEVGIGPVPTLEDVINLDTMRTLQPDQILLSGDLLQVYDASDLARPSSSASSMAEGAWEFQAVGGVTFEGNRESGDFSGKAYRVTYAQAKDLVHVQGDQRVPAELHYRPRASNSIVSSTLKLWSGSLNTKTMRPSGDAADGRLELAPGSQIVPRGQGQPDGSNQPAPTVRPRDAVKDLFKAN